MITSILCPLDGSDHAFKALNLAADLAERYQARLCLLHVYMRHLSSTDLKSFRDKPQLKTLIDDEIERMDSYITSVVGAYPTSGYTPPPSDAVVTKVAEVLLEEARGVAAERNIDKVASVCVNGEPAKAILEQVDVQNTDCIVMGSRGLGAIKGMFYGSVSQKVNHLADCTCVTVK